MRLSDADLKATIDAGKRVALVNAGGCSDANCLGDIVRIGYATKEYETDRSGNIDAIHWLYIGPVPLRVNRRKVLPQTYIEG